MSHSRRWGSRWLAASLPLWLLVGCGGDAPAPSLDDKYRDTLSVSPTPAHAGDELTVALQGGAGAAQMYIMQAWDGERWRDAYCIGSDATSDGDERLPKPRRNEESYGCIFGGYDMAPKVEHIRLPDPVDSGTYRLCDHDMNGCTMLEVEARS
jgi:hypothetical protein